MPQVQSPGSQSRKASTALSQLCLRLSWCYSCGARWLLQPRIPLTLTLSQVCDVPEGQSCWQRDILITCFMKENGHIRVCKHKDAIAYRDLSKIMNVYHISLLLFLLRFMGKENVRSLLCPFWCFCSVWIIVTFFLLVNFYLP